MPALLSLPNEILLCIVESLAQEADINTCAQLSTQLYALFNNVLYDRTLQKSRFVVIWAAENGRLKTMEKVIHAGGAMLDTDTIYYALEKAAAAGHIHVLKLLLEKYRMKDDGIVGSIDTEDLSPLLYIAAKGGHAPIIELLLEEGADINETYTEFDSAAIVGATELGDESIIEQLLDHGADIEARDLSGRTPLMIASASGKKHVVELLLGKGAAMYAVDEHDQDAFCWAKICLRTPIIELLRGRRKSSQERSPALETTILRSCEEFLNTEKRRSEAASEAALEVCAGAGEKKVTSDVGDTDFGDVASATTQQFLKDITRISMCKQDFQAILATELLGSINRQGLAHPTETVVTFITLETSTNSYIAQLAFMEHRALHEKHEAVLEREYMKAVQSTYNYQRQVVRDSHGATKYPIRSKLCLFMEVLKISKMESRQRFLANLCNQMDFDLNKLIATSVFSPSVDFSRFIAENLAFFEYQTIGEVQTTVTTMERMATTTGATVAQAIESEVFDIGIESVWRGGQQGEPTPVDATSDKQPNNSEACGMAGPSDHSLSLDADRLRQLTAASIILLLMWEVRTYLRRLYGMGMNCNDTKCKALAQDLKRVPIQVQGIYRWSMWKAIQSHLGALRSQRDMLQKCKALIELMHTHKE